MSRMKVVLATSSRWRREIFKRMFPKLYSSDEDTFLSPDIDEKAIRDDDPAKMVLLIAEAKSKAVEGRVAGADLVITCDQVTVCEGDVREKPADVAQARTFLRSYAGGKPVECINGLVVWHVPSGRRLTAVDRSTVTFAGVSEAEADEMAEADPVCLTTAGGFSLGHDSPLSRRTASLEGTVASVEGFPYGKVREMMLELCPGLPCQLEALGRPVKCVLFDMDGLLLNTESFYSVATNRILKRFGLKFSWEIKSRMMGKKALEAIKIMVAHYGLEGKVEPEAFLKEREEILDTLFPQAELMAGVERLTRHLKNCGVPMAVATSSHARHFEIKTERHRAFFREIFACVVTGDMVTRSKPDPEIFLEAFGRLGLDGVKPEEVLVFEDAPLGVQAGGAAGMKTVMVSEKEPGACLPDQHLKTMLHFLPEQWGLPPMPNSFKSKLLNES